MKKTRTRLVIALVAALCVTTTSVEARRGNASYSGSNSHSSNSSRSSSSRKVNLSKTDSALSRASKSQQSQEAWQRYQEKRRPVAPPVAYTPPNPSADQLNRIEREVADVKRQQQNHNTWTAVKAVTDILTHRPNQTTVNNQIYTNNTPVPKTVNPVVNPTVTPKIGISWGKLFMWLAGLIFLFWIIKSLFKKESSPKTLYKL